MKLTKIARSKSFEMVNGYGLKRWEKFGIEADLENNEDPIEGYKQLDLIIVQAYKDSYKPEPPKEIQVKSKVSSFGNMIEAITTCTTIEVLKTFEKLAKSKPEFQTAYDNRLNQLANITE